MDDEEPVAEPTAEEAKPIEGEPTIGDVRGALEVQLTRDLGVVRYLGFDTLEEFVESISQFNRAKNIVVGIEEIGIHCIYPGFSDRINQTLVDFLRKYRPTSILYIGEDINVGGFEADYFGGEELKNSFLEKVRKLGIPIEFGMFEASKKSEPGVHKLKMFDEIDDLKALEESSKKK